MPFFSRHSQPRNAEWWKGRKKTWFATKLSHLRLHLFDNLFVSFSFFFRLLNVIPEEKKSVISNFLIVIVFVLYCVPLWLFYDLFMKFMLFPFAPPRTWHKRIIIMLFKLNSMEFKARWNEWCMVHGENGERWM